MKGVNLMKKVRGLLKTIGIMLLILGLGTTTVEAKELNEKDEELAKAYLNVTQKEDYLAVIVEGSLTDKGINVEGLQEDVNGAYETYKINLTKQIDEVRNLLKVKKNRGAGYGNFYAACCKLIDYLGNVTATQEELENVYEGILQDQHCFGKIRPEIDTKMCLTMEECQASGYGLVIKGVNDKNTFYAFDAVGNEKVEQILFTTAKERHIIIKVIGELESDTIKVASIEEVK